MRQMKDSGIEWLGEIPAEWEVHRIKNNFQIISGSGFKPEYQGKISGDYPVCKASDISLAGKYIESAANYIDIDIAENQMFSIIPKNSILFAKIGEAMKKNNRGICMVDCCTDNNCEALVPNKIDCVFSYYMLLCVDMCWFDNAGTIPSISNIKLLSHKFAYPSLPEQQRIAAYLDAKCGEIDKVMSKTRESIAEYKKLKQSIITEAVTNPKWEVVKLKYIAELDPQVNTNALEVNDIVTFTPMECIRNGYFENRQFEFSKMNNSYVTYQEGDIVFAKVTPCFENGNIAIMRGLYSGVGFGSSELFVVRARKVDAEYLFYYFQNDVFKDKCCSTMTGTGGLKRVSPYFVYNYSVELPPKDEQQRIVAYLDKKCSEIDNLIAKKEQLLTELEKYKKSLIYECVTGKREVG